VAVYDNITGSLDSVLKSIIDIRQEAQTIDKFMSNLYSKTSALGIELRSSLPVLHKFLRNFNELTVNQQKLIPATSMRQWVAFELAKKALLSTLTATEKINDALILANNLIERRGDLQLEVLSAQVMTGASQDKILEATRELVALGMEERGSLGERARMVTMMNQALGLSVHEGAKLAYVFEGQLKGSLRDIANILTRVVDQTALTASEAAHVANELGRAAMFLSPTARGGIGEVISGYEELEGVIKKFGGSQGVISRYVADTAKDVEHSMDAFRLGLSPARLLGKGGAEALLKSLEPQLVRLRQIKDMGVDSAPYYQAMLGALADFTNIKDLSTLNALVEASREYRKERHSTLTIKQKWQDQMVQTGQVFSMLKNSVSALVMEAMLPAVGIIRNVAEWINKLLDVVRQSPRAVLFLKGTLTVLAAVAIPATVAALSGLALTLAMVAKNAIGAAAALTFGSGGAMTIGKAIKATLKMGGLMRGLSWLLTTAMPRVIQWLLPNLLRVALPLAIAYGVASIVDRYWKESLDRLEQRMFPKTVSPWRAAESSFQSQLGRLLSNPQTSRSEFTRFVEGFYRESTKSGILTPGQVNRLVGDAFAGYKLFLESKSARMQLGLDPVTPATLRDISQDELRKLDEIKEVLREHLLELNKVRTEEQRRDELRRLDAENKAKLDALQRQTRGPFIP
jgi:hypothetical protein